MLSWSVPFKSYLLALMSDVVAASLHICTYFGRICQGIGKKTTDKILSIKNAGKDLNTLKFIYMKIPYI